MTTVFWFIFWLLIIGIVISLGALSYVTWKGADKNDDGKVSLEEMQEALEKTIKEGKTVIVYNTQEFISNVKDKLKK